MLGTLESFFQNAASAKPVKPRPVTFRAVARGKAVPGGGRNPTGQTVATVVGAIVFAGGNAFSRARIAAREALADLFPGKVTDEYDLGVEATYQLLQMVLRQYDAETGEAGAELFPSAGHIRDMVDSVEATRIMKAYEQYVEEEHPEVCDAKTFRSAGEGSR